MTQTPDLRRQVFDYAKSIGASVMLKNGWPTTVQVKGEDNLTKIIKRFTRHTFISFKIWEK